MKASGRPIVCDTGCSFTRGSPVAGLRAAQAEASDRTQEGLPLRVADLDQREGIPKARAQTTSV